MNNHFFEWVMCIGEIGKVIVAGGVLWVMWLLVVVLREIRLLLFGILEELRRNRDESEKH